MIIVQIEYFGIIRVFISASMNLGFNFTVGYRVSEFSE